MSMQNDNIKGVISRFGDKKVLVVGDVMLDQYTFGDVTRISPEAPIQIVKKTKESFTLGGAANVANNLAALGAKPILCGVIGNDYSGKVFMDLLRDRGIDGSGIFVHDSKPTIVKHRVVSGGYQLLRIDDEDTSGLGPDVEKGFFSKIEPSIAKSDIVILSDYAKGAFSKNVVAGVLSAAKKYGKKVLADFKPQNKNIFVGADLISPNLKEAKEMSGFDKIEEIGPALVNHFNADVLVTRGADGITIFRRDKSSVHIPGKKVEVFDVSGAGDTTIATTALALASGLDLETAARFANAAGGIVVQKPGTATLTSEELLSALQLDTHVAGVGVVPKLWGYEKWLENNDKYCCKLLSLNKGYQCSLHYHKDKDEMFMVTKGHVRLEKNGEILHLREGAFVRLEPGTIHRFTGLEDSVIMEVSTHHDEGDSFRLEESKRVA